MLGVARAAVLVGGVADLERTWTWVVRAVELVTLALPGLADSTCQPVAEPASRDDLSRSDIPSSHTSML